MNKIAAIDVGSNAMRMVVGELDESWQVNVLENIRLPVRLGQDVFHQGFVETAILQQTEEAFLRFKRIAENYGVQKLRAVATSAAREASNRDMLVDHVYRASGIELEVISAAEEVSRSPSLQDRIFSPPRATTWGPSACWKSWMHTKTPSTSLPNLYVKMPKLRVLASNVRLERKNSKFALQQAGMPRRSVVCGGSYSKRIAII